MHPIPTIYNGRQFRSRLEARWAAMFDLLGWPFEYKPCDMAGWIPDFLLPGTKSKIWVEVKPAIIGVDDHLFDVKKMATAMKKSNVTGELLLLGLRPFQQGYGVNLGILYDRLWFPKEPINKSLKGYAIIGRSDLTSGFDFFHSLHSYDHRIAAGHEGVCYPRDCDDFLKLWQRAGNKVQWQKNNWSEHMFLIPEKISFIERELLKKNRSEIWQKIFEKTLKKFKNHLIGDVIKARYIQGRTVEFTCSTLEINKTLYFKYREIALNAITAGLIQEGIIKFYE